MLPKIKGSLEFPLSITYLIIYFYKIFNLLREASTKYHVPTLLIEKKKKKKFEISTLILKV